MDFAEMAHKTATREFYPEFATDWGALDYELVETSALGSGSEFAFLDQRLGIDVVMRIMTEKFPEPIPLFVQERWRRVKYAGFREVTMTHSKPGNGLPAQITRMIAPLFVYGYYHSGENRLYETLVIDMMKMYKLLATDVLETNEVRVVANDTRMIAISFDELIENDAVLFHFRPEMPVELDPEFKGFFSK